MSKKRIYDIGFLLVWVATAVGLLVFTAQSTAYGQAHDDIFGGSFETIFGLLLTGHCLVQETVLFFCLRYLLFGQKPRTIGKTTCAWAFLALAFCLLAYPWGVLLGIIPYI